MYILYPRLKEKATRKKHTKPGSITMGFLVILPLCIPFGCPMYAIGYSYELPGLPFGCPMKPYGIPTNSIWTPWVFRMDFLGIPMKPHGISYVFHMKPYGIPTNSIWYALGTSFVLLMNIL